MFIFVSYRSLDRQLVNQLVTDLTDMGHDVWYDQELEGGQTWWDNILQNIRKADLLVFAITPNSVSSYPCQLEYTYANALSRHIIPVDLSQNINYDLLPVILQERQIVRYKLGDLEAYKKLAAAIRKLPPALALPDPLPEPPAMPISPLAPIRTAIDSPTLTHDQQVALLHHLRSYLGHPEYSTGARELLQRLSEHPTLLASVLREIDAMLKAPPPTVSAALPDAKPEPAEAASPWKDLFKAPPKPAPVEGEVPDAEEQPEVVVQFTPDEGEEVLRELRVSFMGGSILGMAAGYFTIGIASVAVAAARKALDRRMVMTNRRIVFMPNLSDPKQIDIPYSDIKEIKKTMWSTDPAIEITLPNDEKVRFTLVAAGGFGFGNRDVIIEAIHAQMKG